MPYAEPANKRAHARAYYARNRERAIEQAKENYRRNKSRLKPVRKAWRERNREKLRVFHREYHRRRSAAGFRRKDSTRAKERRHERNREMFRRRYKSDLPYTLLRILRYRLWKVVKGAGRSGNARAMELLGCSIEQFCAHIEARFTHGMSWKNYGRAWHLDHIIPCAAFDLCDPRQQRQCFHYTNLRPLWARANIRKGKRVLDPQLSLLM